MKKAKNIWSLLLAVALILTVFAGCSGGAGGDAVESPEAEETADSGGESNEGSDELVTLKLFMAETWWPYSEWKGRIPELFSQNCGVTLDVNVAADDTALKLAIASGDAGDLVCTTDFTRMSNANVSYNLDEIAEEYGIEMSIHSVMRYINTADDGKMYTQMVGYSPDAIMKSNDKIIYEGQGLVCRSDILEALGVKEEDVNSIADLETVLAQVKEKYPDMIPFIYSGHNNAFMQTLVGATHDMTGFIDVDGELYLFLQDPNMKEYYMLMNKWYRNGWMTDENFTWEGEAAFELVTAGKIFCSSDYSSTADSWNPQLEQAGCDFTYTQMINIMNEPEAVQSYRTGGWRGLFIPKSCTNPEAALKFCLYAWSPEGQRLLLWGEEGKDWNWNEDETYPKLSYNFQQPNEDDGMKYWGWMSHDGTTNTLPDWSAGEDNPTALARVALTKITNPNPVLSLIRIDADSEQNTIMNNLIELEKTMKVEIITAATEEEALAKYDEMIATANELGAQELLDWAKPIYEEKKAEYDAIKNNAE